MIPLRTSRGLDPELSDALRGAFAADREVTLTPGDSGLALHVDGEQLVDGLPLETFSYPLHRGEWTADERALLDELLQERERERAAARRERFGDVAHVDAEGVDP